MGKPATMLGILLIGDLIASMGTVLLLYYADEPILLIRICACYYHQQRRFDILVSLSEILPTPPDDRNSPFLFIPKILPDIIISTATNILSFPMLLYLKRAGHSFRARTRRAMHSRKQGRKPETPRAGPGWNSVRHC